MSACASSPSDEALAAAKAEAEQAKAEAEQAKAEAVQAKAEAEQAKLEVQRLKLALEAALGGRAANPGIVTRAVAKVKRNDDRNWVPGGMPIHEVDRIYGMLLLALKEGRTEAETDTSGPKEAVEVVQATLDSFFTAVLATVHAGAWRLD